MNSAERLKVIKEKQNEERLRKLEELKKQANSVQLSKQKVEEERRLLIEQHKMKELNRRQQVEERKKEIMEIEKSRKEAILRRNQERDLRIENKKKMERSSIVFAFGSSTPRMLDPAESNKTYWTNRRATSTINVMSLSMTAAIPDRSKDTFSGCEQINDGRRRAVSAGNRKDETNSSSASSTYSSTQQVARKKTDLMPVVPSLRETLSSPTSATSSGNKTSPNRAVSMSRLDVLAQPRHRYVSTKRTETTGSLVKSNVDFSRSMTHLISGRKPVRYSATFELRLSPTQVIHKEVQPKLGGRNKTNNSISHLSAHNGQSSEKNIKVPKKTSPSLSRNVTREIKIHQPTGVETTTNKVSCNEKQSDFPTNNGKEKQLEANNASEQEKVDNTKSYKEDEIEADGGSPIDKQSLDAADLDSSCSTQASDTLNDLAECDMAASITSTKRISSEEEAKAALAERRRLAREQAEREAEEERKRLEAERITKENEEREQLQLAEMARKAEEDRLQAAILEAQKREEEERKQKELLLKQKLEKADAERKAKEEADRQRQETELKLQKEEEERQARRKRVEAIMSRTRNRLSTSMIASTEINSS